MSLWKIAWRSIQQRGLASFLTAVSMALGVALVVAVLVTHTVVSQSFHRGGEGYDLIVGANKASGLELVLSSVYYLGQPRENIPYSVYKELAQGRLSTDVETAIPICLGDNYAGYRVVGTVPDMFDALRYLGDQKYEFAPDGRNFHKDAMFEAVIGETVARKTSLKVGDTFRPTHDVSGEDADKHEPFTIVGVLKHTGTPNDRALFVNLEGFYRTAGHIEMPEEEAEHSHDSDHRADEAAHHDEKAGHDDKEAAHQDKEEAHHHDGPIPDSLKKVTAVLVSTDQTKPGITRALARQINDGVAAQAAIPSVEIAGLLDGIVGNLELVLLLFAVMIVLVAGIGMMVSIYTSMSERQHEIAVMRALGASRWIVMLVVLLESILLSLAGGVLGLILGHGLVGLAGPLIAEQTGVSVGLLQFRMLELVLIPALIVLASIVGYLPAVAAYRTDVARALTANP